MAIATGVGRCKQRNTELLTTTLQHHHLIHDSLNVTSAMATLAARDQENLVHNLQAGTAGKSLSAGLKGLNAKTPANKAPKTPFKIPLNDENGVTKGGKGTLGKGLATGKKEGKLESNAFVTPAGK
jgi:hypothetical protein